MTQRQAKSKSPCNRQITETALLEDDVARKAFEKLTGRQVDREKLMSLLSRIPHASNKVLPLVDGMGDRSVRALADRIRSWADTIERVNASPCLSPDFLTSHAMKKRNPKLYPEPLDSILTPEYAAATAKLFHSLPRTLRLYADHLKARLEFFHPTGHRRRDFGFQPLRLRKWFTLQLLRLVRDSAGSPCYKEVATLLGRAYEIAGGACTVTEENLTKLEKNNPWFTWLLFEASLREKANQGHGISEKPSHT